MNISV